MPSLRRPHLCKIVAANDFICGTIKFTFTFLFVCHCISGHQRDFSDRSLKVSQAPEAPASVYMPKRLWLL